jgi:putative oxidoreductase
MSPGVVMERLAIWILGGVFIYAGIIKAMDPNRFAVEIGSFRVVPEQVSLWIAWYLPWLEILAGGAILTRPSRPGGLTVIGGLLLIFLVAALSAWSRGIDFTCGCFGGKGVRGGIGFFVRDLALLGMVSFIWIRDRTARMTPKEVFIPPET